MLVANFPKELRELESAYEKRDWLSIQKVAHKLNGGASYCGTARLKQACLNLEEAVKLNKEEQILTPLYQRMIDEIRSVEKQAINHIK
jgi:two-component system aerobic respiration control sensor histidine kinase ArcB